MADKLLEIQLFSQAQYLRSLVPQGSKHCSKSLYLLRVFEINDIFNFRQNSRWQPKFRSLDKCIFAFYAEIQDGRQKWQESDFCLKSPVDSLYTLRAKNFVKIALSRTVSEISVFTFHAEIQDGHQKWRESDFCEKSPVHSGHPGGRKFQRNPTISDS